MTTNNDDTTLEVVSDAEGGTAWRECGPGGCTVSRQRSRSGEGCNDARAPSNAAAITTTPAHAFAPGEVVTMTRPGTAFNGTFVVVAGDTLQPLAKGGRRAESAFAGFAAVIGLAATALRWTLPIRWEGKRRKRRARGKYREAKRGGRVQLGAGWGLGLTEVASGVEKLRKAMKSAGPWEERSDV